MQEMMHLLTMTDATILAASCTVIGSALTVAGFKLAPMVKRFYVLLKLKLFMFRYQ